MSDTEENNLNDTHMSDEVIDLNELFRVIWEGKIIIILFTAVVAIISIFYSLKLQDYYLSESVLVVRDSPEGNSFSQYSGLASFAGISLPSSGGSSIHELIQTIQSRDFVKHLITFENVLPSLMAAESYDLETQKLSFNPTHYNTSTKEWVREPTKNHGIVPSYLEAHKNYLGILTISLDSKTGLVSITVEHISPIFAKEFLELIIQEINAINRKIDIDNSNKAVDYLNNELSKISVVQIKDTINQLVKSELETLMLADIHEEYSLIVLEPPFIPEIKSKPMRSYIVIFLTILGGLLSVIITLLHHYVLRKGKFK